MEINFLLLQTILPKAEKETDALMSEFPKNKFHTLICGLYLMKLFNDNLKKDFN